MKKGTISYASNSAPYHVAPNIIFFQDNMSNIITDVVTDPGRRVNISINNEERVKGIIFDSIKKAYNQRIQWYKLNYNLLNEQDMDKLIINYYYFKDPNMPYQKKGTYDIYPKYFICNNNQCNHYVRIDKLKRKDLICEKCNIGKYEQMSILKFCEQCGTVDNFFYSCKEHATDFIRLLREDKDNLRTWKFQCGICKVEKDIIGFPCNHTIGNGAFKISNSSSTPYTPVVIRESGLFTPVSLTIVDGPKDQFPYIVELGTRGDYINYGILIDAFKEFGITTISQFLNQYKANRLLSTDNEQCKLKYESMEKKLESIKKIMEQNDLNIRSELIDYLLLTGKGDNSIKSVPYNSYLKGITTISEREYYGDQYEPLLEAYGIKEVYYIPEINLITALVGMIKGQFKYWENFPPHFELIWDNIIHEQVYLKRIDRENSNFDVYVVPYITEGILFELNSNKIIEWLIKNEIVSNVSENTFKYLMNLEINSKEYDAVFTLLHTIAHTIIKKIQLFSGIGVDSCGEILYPHTGCILIYSKDPINMGPLQYLFENKMFIINGLLDNLNDFAKGCSLDPLCYNTTGACFSCLYLPEYVCAYFNKNLDRSFLRADGKRGITNAFW